MNTTLRLAIGSASRTVLSLAQMAIGFVMMPFLIGHLGDHWYGVWAAVGSAIAYLTTMDLGLSQAIILYLSRYIPTKQYDQANRVVNTAFILYIGISAVVIALTAVLAAFGDSLTGSKADGSVASIVILILGLSLAIELPFNALSGIVGAYVRYELLSAVRLLVLAFNTALTFHFIGQGHGIVTLALISLASCVLFNILFLCASKYCFRELRFGTKWFDRSCVKDLTRIGVWSFLSTVSYMLKFRLNTIVISIGLTPSVVTHFSVGSRLADYFRDLMLQATNLSTPIMTKYHVLEQEDQLRSKLLFLIKINATLAFFGGGMILVLGKSFIATWMNSSYEDAYGVLVILVAVAALEIALDPARTTLLGMGKAKFVAITEVAEAISGLLLSILLVRKFGPLGVAVGTGLPIIIIKTLVTPAFIASQIGFGRRKIYLAILPIALATGAYVLLYYVLVAKSLLHPSYASIIAIGALACPVYLVLAYASFFLPEEKALLGRLLPRRIFRF